MNKKLSEKLWIAMQLRGMNLTQLANGSGVNKGTISKYLNNKIQPKQNQIIKMAQCLNISPTWLLGLTDNISNESIKVSSIAIKEAVGIEPTEEEIMQQSLVDDITAICSRQDLDTLKTIYSVVKTLAKK